MHRLALLAVSACLLAAMLLSSSAAQAGSSSCASASRAAKATQGKGKKAKKRKAKRVCRAPAQQSAPTAVGTAAPPPSTPSTGGDSSIPPPTAFNTLSFSDDFNGSSLDASKWIAQRTDASGFGDGTSCFVDNPNNVSVANGTLRLTSRRESSAFNCPSPYGDFLSQYTSGMVSTWGRFSQAYGRYEIRAKITPAQVRGLQSSLWLWPADASRYGSWPGSGEIDIAEMYSAYPDRAIPYVHYNAGFADPNVTNTNCMISNLGAFHTYGVEWTRTSIRVIYDGRTCLTDYFSPAAPLTAPQPFDQPFLIALTQGLGVAGNAFDPATTPLPATTEIDYVKVWK